jgi:arsenate reductase
LTWLTDHEHEVDVIDYLSSPLTVNDLKSLASQLNQTPALWIRKEEEAYKTHIQGKSLTDEQLFQLMCEFPKLIQRPIVVWNGRAIVARPLELLIDAVNDAD